MLIYGCQYPTINPVNGPLQTYRLFIMCHPGHNPVHSRERAVVWMAVPGDNHGPSPFASIRSSWTLYYLSIAAESRQQKVGMSGRTHGVSCAFHATHGILLYHFKKGVMVTTAVMDVILPSMTKVITCENIPKHSWLSESTLSCHGRHTVKSRYVWKGIQYHKRKYQLLSSG